MDGIEIIHPGDGIAVVELHGEHDWATSGEVATLLKSEVRSNDLVVVDVSGAKFVDSSFLHNLVLADNVASVRGSRFVPQMGTAPIVRTALQASGLLEQLSVAHTRDEALT